MNNDILKRLDAAANMNCADGGDVLAKEAADEIRMLRKLREDYREVLKNALTEPYEDDPAEIAGHSVGDCEKDCGPCARQSLVFLLTRIGSWTSARWDQHLRHEFGDEIANRTIVWLYKRHIRALRDDVNKEATHGAPGQRPDLSERKEAESAILITPPSTSKIEARGGHSSDSRQPSIPSFGGDHEASGDKNRPAPAHAETGVATSQNVESCGQGAIASTLPAASPTALDGILKRLDKLESMAHPPLPIDVVPVVSVEKRIAKIEKFLTDFQDYAP